MARVTLFCALLGRNMNLKIDSGRRLMINIFSASGTFAKLPFIPGSELNNIEEVFNFQKCDI